MNQLKLTAILAAISACVIAVSACAAIKPVVRDANEVAARLLCERAFVEKTGLSPAEVRRIYCDSQEILEPFLAAVKRAKSEAAPVAVKKAGL